MIEAYAILKSFGPWLFAAGTAYMSVKAGLNGTRGRVERIERTIDEHMIEDKIAQIAVTESIARLETKVDLLIDHKVK